MAENITPRERATSIMGCRLPFSTAEANARDLDDAGLLADRAELVRLREFAEWAASLNWRPGLDEIRSGARVALGKE
jgi:hypothetical protein